MSNIWTIIRIKKSTLDKINYIKAKLKLNNIDISKDELINQGVNLVEVNNNGRKNN